MKYRRHLIALSLAGAAALVSYGLVTIQLFDGLFGEAERKTIDYRLRSSRSLNRDSSQIALVLFDSMGVRDWNYLSPFPRAQLADLIRTASANGATVIGLDVFLDRRYPWLSAEDNGDERLRDAIRDAGNVVLVAMTEQQGSGRRLLRPDPYFADVAAAVGTADLPTPFEGARDATLLAATDSGYTPGFPLALYAVHKGLSVDSLMDAYRRTGRLHVDGLPRAYSRAAPEDPLMMPIRFAGLPSRPGREAGAFRAYEASTIAMVGAATGFAPNEGLQAWLGGHIVMLGSGWHEGERFRSPFYDHRFSDSEIAGWTYGVEVHANTLQNLLGQDYLVPASPAIVLALLLLVGLAASGATFWRGAKWGIAAGVIAFALVGWAALETFARTGIVLPIIAPLVAAVLSYTSAVAYVSIVEGREKRLIRGAFSKYVPPGVVDDLVADPSRLKLGGEKRAISILFSDVAGFTSMSEILPPETLVSILNEYLDEMSDIVFDEMGTLDKYIGDAVMAFWGAPSPVPDHALRACRTAVRMQRRLRAMNESWQASGAQWPALHIRIGINTGNPVVGNIGGERRFDYTALGDAVNLAARLEPACKSYGVSMMIAEPTRHEAGDAIVVRELDMLAVYGKAEPVRVYQLVGMKDDPIDDALAEALGHYENGLAAYRRRDFELALRYFETALELRPGDGPAEMYRERSEDYITNPPPADWDFVERRQVK